MFNDNGQRKTSALSGPLQIAKNHFSAASSIFIDHPTASHVLAIALLCIAVFTCYANSLQNGFVSDDHYIIELNQNNLSWESLIQTFTEPAGLLEMDRAPYYRPVDRASYLIDRYFFSLKPLGYHVVNVLLHVLTVCLLYLMLCRLGVTPILSFGAALLFALHPVNTETVDFISARNNTLATFFILAAFHSFLSAEENQRPAGYARTGFLFFLGMLTKESAVMFLPFLFVFRYTLSRSSTDVRTIRSWDFTFLLAPIIFFFLYLVLRSLAVDDGHFLNKLAGLSGRLKQLAYIVPTYASALVAPLTLNFSYTIPPGWSIMPLPFAATALVFLTVIAYGLVRRNLLLIIGMAWCVLNFVPISNILPLPSAPMAERYLYTPLIGVSMIVAAFLEDLRGRTRGWHLPLVLVLAAAIPFGILTYQRNFAWKDDLSVTKGVADANPGYAFGQFDFGAEAYQSGDIVTARQAFERSLRLDSAFPWASWANYYLGSLDLERNHTKTAISSFKNAIAVNPTNSSARYALAVLSVRNADPVSRIYWQDFTRYLSPSTFPLLLEAQKFVRDTVSARSSFSPATPGNVGRPADSRTWRPFYRYGTGTTFYYDPSSVQDTGIDRTVLTMQRLVPDDARMYAFRIIRFPLVTLSEVRFLLSVNCRQSLFKTTTIEFRNSETAVLGKIWPDREAFLYFQYIPTGTPLRKLVHLICSSSTNTL